MAFLENKSGLDAKTLDAERQKLLQAYNKWQEEPTSPDLKRKAIESLFDVHDAFSPGEIKDELQRIFNLCLLPMGDNTYTVYLFTREDYVNAFIERTKEDLKFKREEFFTTSIFKFMYQLGSNTGRAHKESKFKGIHIDPFTPDMLKFSWLDIKQAVDAYEIEEVLKQLQQQRIDHTKFWKAIANDARCHVVLSHKGKMVQFLDSKDKRWFVLFTRESTAAAFRDFYASTYGVEGLTYEVLFGDEIIERVRGESSGCIFNLTPYKHEPIILRFKEGEVSEEPNKDVREILAPDFIDSHL